MPTAMLLQRRFPRKLLVAFAVRVAIVPSAWAAIVYGFYAHFQWTAVRIPFLPVATVGTAVAFYVGFKNNSAYDRFWEGRKIWGGIVNSSRTWANYVFSYVLPGDDSTEAHAVRRDLIYRHLAYINALRLQLRKTSRFFDKPAPSTKRRLDAHKDAMRNDWDKELTPFVDDEELAFTKTVANAASHLLVTQGRKLSNMVRDKRLDLFHQIAMMEVVQELYGLQGKAERIKATPFPRQYAEYSRVFTRAFVFLVPFGLLDVFGADAASSYVETWVRGLPMIVSAGRGGGVFTTMEGIGDSSEDPFERSMNDVPMNALCRVIEIDLRQMLGETDTVPEKEQAHDGILY